MLRPDSSLSLITCRTTRKPSTNTQIIFFRGYYRPSKQTKKATDWLVQDGDQGCVFLCEPSCPLWLSLFLLRRARPRRYRGLDRDNVIPVHLDYHRAHNDVDGQHHAKSFFLAQEDTFQPGHGATVNPNTLSDLQVGVWFQADISSRGSAERGNLQFRKGNGSSVAADEVDNTWQLQHS